MTAVTSSMRSMQWKFLKNEMVQYFKNKPTRSSTIDVEARLWPRFASVEQIHDEGYVPALIWKHGEPRKIAFKKSEIDRLAFDEGEDAHISYLFKSRLFRIHCGTWIEECVVDHVNVDPVGKHMYFVKMKRHVPGKMTEVEVPLTMVGLLGSPAYLSGAQVELATPTIKCEVIGDEMPAPFIVDVSKLSYSAPSVSMYLRDIADQLPKDGSVRFGRELNQDSTEVAWTYFAGRVPEVKLDAEYEDPNFMGPRRRFKYMLTYKNFWPKQH